jgi:hypothetical protein
MKRRRLLADAIVLAVILTPSAAVCAAVSPYSGWAPWPFHNWPRWVPDLWEDNDEPVNEPPIIAPGPGRRCGDE